LALIRFAGIYLYKLHPELKQNLRQPMKKIIAVSSFVSQLPIIGFLALAMVVLLLAVTGCESNQADTFLEPSHSQAPGWTNEPEQFTHSESLILREGDVLKITFPGSPNLDTSQQIRRDGKITLESVGEITAVGVTPSDLEKAISTAYGSQLPSRFS
jgi:protein involved in polysaccharide export with SLBB domain